MPKLGLHFGHSIVVQTYFLKLFLLDYYFFWMFLNYFDILILKLIFLK